MSKYKPSPFAPLHFPDMPKIDGFTMATAEAGVRYKGRTDLWVMVGQAGTQVAGVFTQNLCPGAPVDWSRKALSVDTKGPRVVVVNSGTANVFAGQKSVDAVVETAQGIADIFGAARDGVLLSSTGVIGEALDASKLTAQFSAMKASLSAEGWADAARAIMTTDTYAKGATDSAVIDGVRVQINGIAKGSGMIAPDMATMLAYVATDANINDSVLQVLLSDQVGSTFNAITVDSDTSTSDTLLLLASCAADHRLITDVNDPRLDDFKAALHRVLFNLAMQIIKDGEGISKFIRVTISGAVSDKSAKKIGMSIANSPLVKTAVAGQDANWGRIIMAVGKAGEPAERDKLTVHIGPHLLAQHGQPAPHYTEADGAAYMKNAEIDIRVDLGLGDGQSVVYGCDLTHQYIDINADYRS
ncbi:bifunctional glutamate N-acetyltransferase/amino-acid acetyltransferase ArgJ [Fretibacter rubidus]|uniref:bifunctional glutamate N-acetyltransferase/amino-acid acetyltransferase ArgJ n=1 Tax=Fretibacter rubidus TaxID=570162 RepID=UPI00352AEBF6